MQPDDLVEAFDYLDSWEERYRLLIELGRELPAFPDSARCEANRVEGCTSQVWLLAGQSSDEPPRLTLQADSDAFIVKGLIAIILAAYSGRTGDEIRSVDIQGLFERLGLGQHLSPNRRNGFFAMVERIHSLADQATT